MGVAASSKPVRHSVRHGADNKHVCRRAYDTSRWAAPLKTWFAGSVVLLLTLDSSFAQSAGQLFDRLSL